MHILVNYLFMLALKLKRGGKDAFDQDKRGMLNMAFALYLDIKADVSSWYFKAAFWIFLVWFFFFSNVN